MSNDILSYELNHLLNKSKTDRLLFLNSLMTKLYEYMSLELNRHY